MQSMIFDSFAFRVWKGLYIDPIYGNADVGEGVNVLHLSTDRVASSVHQIGSPSKQSPEHQGAHAEHHVIRLFVAVVALADGFASFLMMVHGAIVSL
mmetsp:Transcript_52/g.140  ORF Transcript_52/g.140 Transcript_52/m.140 type:complete len:97 (+) Transcript_52:151-441(+)